MKKKAKAKKHEKKKLVPDQNREIEDEEVSIGLPDIDPKKLMGCG